MHIITTIHSRIHQAARGIWTVPSFRNMFAVRSLLFRPTNLKMWSYLLLIILGQILLSLLAETLIRRANSKLILISIDSLTHGLHSSLCWFTVLVLEANELSQLLPLTVMKRSIYNELAYAFLVGCCLDIDHFIAGSSLSLSKATNLKQRPFGHNFMFVIGLGLFVSMVCLKNQRTKGRIKALVLTSCISHLSRDGMKRGFNFVPFVESHTPPISLCLHILILVVLPFVPLLFGFTALRLEPLFTRNSVTFSRLLFYSVVCGTTPTVGSPGGGPGVVDESPCPPSPTTVPLITTAV